jgi:hypothetical protein
MPLASTKRIANLNISHSRRRSSGFILSRRKNYYFVFLLQLWDAYDITPSAATHGGQ